VPLEEEEVDVNICDRNVADQARQTGDISLSRMTATVGEATVNRQHYARKPVKERAHQRDPGREVGRLA